MFQFNVYYNNAPIKFCSRFLGVQTVLFAELDALTSATQSLIDDPQPDTYIYFIVDNRTAIQIATGWNFPRAGSNHEALSVQLQNNIHLLEVNHFLFFIWVPSHCGIQGNELADNLAKRGANGTSSWDSPIL